MNRELADAIVAFVANPTVIGSGKLAVFRRRPWGASMHWLITSGLAISLLHRLSELNAEHLLPARVYQRLFTLDQASVVRTAELRSDFLDLVASFQQTGVPFVCWKGFALEPDFCPDVRIRPQMDFDFIIPEVAFTAFDRVICAKGYVRTEVKGIEAVYETLPGRSYSLDQVYFPKVHRKLELHLGRDHSPRGGVGIDLNALLNRRRMVLMNSCRVPVLSPEDAFLAHAAHAGRHALDGWVRLGWLLELENFVRLHAENVVLWNGVLRFARHDPQLSRQAAVGLQLSAAVWRGKIPGVLSWAREVLPQSAVSWIEAYGRQLAMADFPGTKLHLLLQREMLSNAEWQRLERTSLYGMRKIPNVSRVTAQSGTPEKIRAFLTQLGFVTRRLRFHCMENLRYFVAKRTFTRFASSR